MIEIKVNDEIRDVQLDVFLGLSLWQTIVSAVGLIGAFAVGIFLYFYLNIPLQIVTFIACFVMLPIGYLVFYTWHEINAFRKLKLIIADVTEPTVKTYHYDNEEYMIQAKATNKKAMKKLEKIKLKKEKGRGKKWKEQ